MPSAPESPLDLLLECHGRMRRVVGAVRALAELDDPLDPRAVPTAEQARDYLRVAVRLHAEDEDLSVAPRLLRLALDQATRDAIATMDDEHEQIVVGVPRVVLALEAFLVDPVGEQPGLVPAAEWLEQVLLPHLDAEEAGVFPACSRLSQDDQATIVREMRLRRQR